MDASVWLWVGFNGYVLGMLAIDLGLVRRRSRAVGIREALVWSFVWIAQSMLFGLGIYAFHGPALALDFLTGYVIEKSLSVDNLFVFILIFSYFKVSGSYQHKVLFWGVLGALVMRASLIALGTALIERFHWVMYVFGGFLVLTGIRMAFEPEPHVEPEANPIVRLARRVLPLTASYHDEAFFVRVGGRWTATPLVIVVIVVEVTDLIFAIDSIPAILAITTDPFIVYSSNVFAILGLRSLYFALAGVVDLFRFLSYGLAAVLSFVGVKMLIADWFAIPTVIALAVVGATLLVAVMFSLLFPAQSSDDAASEPAQEAVEDPLGPSDG